ncbi:MAG: double zinc ribbon domain-containing protein [Halobacteriota archaeon]|uniref:double zinc ribbon domain-containing protein n=1 Tax=Natronomonas sp. TaxID=2184060 RepID=UPI003975F5D1
MAMTILENVFPPWSEGRPAVTCPSCDTSINVAAETCPDCESDVAIECRVCGKTIETETITCPVCGSAEYETFLLE